MKKNVFVALCLSVSVMGLAQQTSKMESLDSVFIDTKLPLARKNSGKVVVRITSEELQRSPGKGLAQIINEASGIEINGSRGNEGQNLGYFVRGGRNRQVVIMIDGVQVNDPSSISNDFDLRLLSASGIESIEIIKGASSVLYGSGAATAVISITSKQTSAKAISAVFTSTLGTNRAANDSENDLEAFTNSVNVSGKLSRFFYSLDFGHRFSEGLSAISAPEKEANFEEDDFDSFRSKLEMGYKISEKITLRRFIDLAKFKAEFDDFNYTDANNLTQSKQLRTGGSLEWKYNRGRFVLNDSHSWIDREISSSFPAMYDAKSSTFDAFGSYTISKEVTILGGVNGNFSSFNSFTIPFGSEQFTQQVNADTAQFEIIDPYLNASYISTFGFNLSGGIRLNNHSNYGTHFVYNVNPSYGFNFGKGKLKILASYSTAYITPSLFQLYDPLYGNPELEPEENNTMEGGLEFTRSKDFRISAVFFSRDASNFVDFVTVDPALFIFQYRNTSEGFTASGLEVEWFKRVGEYFTVSGNYTFTEASEPFALRIPKHKANGALGYTLKEKTYFGLSYQYTGDREDVFFDPVTFESNQTTLEGFGLLDWDASHEISDHVKVFVNVSNILDESYEELYRFQTRGRNFRFGFALSF